MSSFPTCSHVAGRYATQYQPLEISIFLKKQTEIDWDTSISKLALNTNTWAVKSHFRDPEYLRLHDMLTGIFSNQS